MRKIKLLFKRTLVPHDVMEHRFAYLERKDINVVMCRTN